MRKSSRIPGFYKLTLRERLNVLKDFTGLSSEEINVLRRTGSLDLETADRMIENVVGTIELPIGIATNFLINNKDYLVPMAIEEPSVVAAASNAAKMAREGGGIKAISTEPLMFSQVQLVGVGDPFSAKFKILSERDEILRIANEQDPVLVDLGGGAKDIKVRVIDSRMGPMVVTHLIVNVKDAMGANTVNTMAEAVAPYIEKITGGKVYLRIISNLADKRIVWARARIPKEAVGGEEVVNGVLNAYAFAEADPYRAATHNKGIMNGIIAVAVATGQDTRAIEAGAHAYAAKNGRYSSLTTWERDSRGDLLGTIELPLAVGVVGGATKINPVAQVSLKILGVKTARELAEVMASVGLVQNLAALRALATEGIQRGHMALHARNIAAMAGAKGEEIDIVAELMLKRKLKIRVDVAKMVLEEIRAKREIEADA